MPLYTGAHTHGGAGTAGAGVVRGTSVFSFWMLSCLGNEWVGKYPLRNHKTTCKNVRKHTCTYTHTPYVFSLLKASLRSLALTPTSRLGGLLEPSINLCYLQAKVWSALTQPSSAGRGRWKCRQEGRETDWARASERRLPLLPVV